MNQRSTFLFCQHTVEWFCYVWILMYNLVNIFRSNFLDSSKKLLFLPFFAGQQAVVASDKQSSWGHREHLSLVFSLVSLQLVQI